MSIAKFNHSTRNAAPYFNNVFDSLFSDAVNKNYSISKMPQVNISESDKDYKIELAAPGLNKGDFKIELKQENLIVSAAKKMRDAAVQKKYSRKEFEYVSFTRSFLLPEDIDAEKIGAEYVNGILIVTITKKEHLKYETKEIVVS